MKIVRWIFAGALVLCVVLQLVAIPTFAQQTNPPVVQEPSWDSPQTRELAQRACFDCHSNETNWPLYSRVAPMAWFITDHVVEGRAELNFSEWHRAAEDAGEIAEVIQAGEMPLPNYLPLHPEANLSAAEQQQLINGMYATLGGTPGQAAPEGGEHREPYEEHEDEEEY